MNLNVKGDEEEIRLESSLGLASCLKDKTSLTPLCLSVSTNIFLPHLPPFFLDTTLVASEVRMLPKPCL